MRGDEATDLQKPAGSSALSRPAAIRAWLARVRFADWAHFLVLPLATIDAHASRSDTLLAGARGVGIAFTILAFGFLINSVADREMDIDVRKNSLVIPGAGAQGASLIGLVAVCLLLSISSPWPAKLATASCLVLGYIYSSGPRLKRVPVAGSLANVAGFTLLLFVGMQDASLPPRFGWVALVFAALLLQNQLIHEAADRLEDSAGGVRTSWLTLGPRWTVLIAAISGLGAAGATAFIVPRPRLSPVVLAAGAAFGVVFPLLLASRGMEPSRAARLRVTHRWCAASFGALCYFAWRSGTR